MDAKKALRKCLSECMKHMTPDHVDRLVQLGANVNKLHHRTTLLCEASRKGNLEAARKLIAAGAEMEVADNNGCTPLYIACSHGNVDIVRLLVDHGAEVNVKNSNGFTPLVSTLQNSHNDCAKILINHGACVNTDRPKNIYGSTVSLLTYILFAKGDWAMAECLLQAGIRPIKFIPALGFILLEDPTTPVSLIKKFVYAGFDVHVSGWVDLIQRRGEELTSTQKELVELLEYERKNAPTLQRLCRTVIRTAVTYGPSEQHLHMERKIDMLPLPIEVRKYVKLEYL